MITEKKHFCCNLKGLLRNTGRKSMKGFFTKDDGTDCTNKEARSYIQECIDKGWRVIPMGDCDNFDYQTGCKGHKKEEQQ